MSKINKREENLRLKKECIKIIEEQDIVKYSALLDYIYENENQELYTNAMKNKTFLKMYISSKKNVKLEKQIYKIITENNITDYDTLIKYLEKNTNQERINYVANNALFFIFYMANKKLINNS